MPRKLGQLSVKRHTCTCWFCGTKFASAHAHAKWCDDPCNYQAERMAEDGVAHGSTEHRIRQREFHIKQHHNLVNTLAKVCAPCAICLTRLGMGCKRVGRILRVRHEVVRGWVLSSGIQTDPKAARHAAHRIHGAMLPDPVAIMWEQFEAEHKALARFDEQNHWSQHKAAHNWRSSKTMMSRYRSDLVFRAAHNKRVQKRREANPEWVRDYTNAWRRKRHAADPAHKLKDMMCSRLSALLAGRSGSWSKLEYYVGCSFAQLRDHLQRQFVRHMNWNNYGKVWHVDHILPVASFDHSDDRQIRVCWNWQNLRPFWANANIRKGNKHTKPQMHLPLSI